MVGRQAQPPFVVAPDGGAPRDLTPGATYDVPPFNLGEPEAIAFSPDGQELCFTANTDKDEALSTNGDLFSVAVSGCKQRQSESPRIRRTIGDGIYSPDGKWIAYRAQLQPGYESDRWRLMLIRPRQKVPKAINLTEISIATSNRMTWSADSKTIYFQTEEKSEMPIYSIARMAPAASPKPVLANTFNDDLDVSRDGRTLVFTRTNLSMPAEVFAASSDGTNVRQLTHQNATCSRSSNFHARRLSGSRARRERRCKE